MTRNNKIHSGTVRVSQPWIAEMNLILVKRKQEPERGSYTSRGSFSTYSWDLWAAKSLRKRCQFYQALLSLFWACSEPDSPILSAGWKLGPKLKCLNFNGLLSRGATTKFPSKKCLSFMFVDLQIIMGNIYKFHELTACYGERVNNLMQ